MSRTAFRLPVAGLSARRVGQVTLLLLGLVMLASCALIQRQVEPPRVTLAEIRLLELGFLEQRFELGLRVQNPNGFGIRLAGMDYTVKVNGQSFASGVSDEKATVPARGEAVVRVPVTASILDTAQQLLEWRRNPPQTLRYALDGRVHLADFDTRLPFEYSGEVPLKTPQ